MNARQQNNEKNKCEVITRATVMPQCHSCQVPLFLGYPGPSQQLFTWSARVSRPSCESAFAAVRQCNGLLPLGPLVEARAPRAERTLLVAVVERQQGIGAQTLMRRRDQKLFSATSATLRSTASHGNVGGGSKNGRVKMWFG